jgi:polysaccharide pyruvyl transferase WcaK-like protein
MRILLRGSYGGFNLGDDLTFVALVRFLRQELGWTPESLEIYASRHLGSVAKLGHIDGLSWSESKEIDDLVCAGGRTDVSAVRRLGRRLLLLLNLAFFFASICVYRVTKWCVAYGNLIRFFAGLDVIHYNGGGYLAGRWRNRLAFEVLTLRAARMIQPRLKIVGTGIGLGPFHDRLSSFLLRAFLAKFDRLSVRDRRSCEIARAMNPKLEVRCLADDALLLVPMIENLKRRSDVTDRTMAAFNLKDFPDHAYATVADKIDELLMVLREKGLRVEFFSFSQSPGPCDSHILENLRLRHRDAIQAVHDPYEEGLDRFLEHLARARLGFGFAYHFVVLPALMDVPCVAAYAGEYYEQKIKGTAQVLDLPFVFCMEDLKDMDVRRMIDQVLQTDARPLPRVKQLYAEMASQYAAMYRELIQPGADAGR